MNLAKLTTDQVHEVGVFTTAAEAVIQTRRPVEVKPEERRYRLVVDGKLVQVISSRQRGEWWLPDATPPRPGVLPAVVFVFVDFSGERTQFYPIPANKIRPGKVSREDVKDWHDRWEDALRDAKS